MSGLPFFDPPPAVINGYAARALAVWLQQAWEQGQFAALPGNGREDVRLAISALVHAGEAWATRRGSEVGTSEQVVSEVGARWSDEVTVDEAAGILGMSTRRVRTLAADGLGRKVGHVWMLDRDLVMAHAERKAAS